MVRFGLSCSHTVTVTTGLAGLACPTMICPTCTTTRRVMWYDATQRSDPSLTMSTEPSLTATTPDSATLITHNPATEVTDMKFDVGEPETGTVGRSHSRTYDPDLLALMDRVISLEPGTVLPVTLPNMTKSSKDYAAFAKELERCAVHRGYRVRRSAEDLESGSVRVRLVAVKHQSKVKTSKSEQQAVSEPEAVTDSEPSDVVVEATDPVIIPESKPKGSKRRQTSSNPFEVTA